MEHRRRWGGIPALVAVITLALPARATVLQHWTLEELVRRSDRIVEGTVEGSRTALRGPGRIVTETTVRVASTLLGEPATRLVVTQLGGVHGAMALEVSGTSRLEPGDRVVLMLRKRGDAHYLVGMAQGAFTQREGVWSQRLNVPLLSAGGELLPAPRERAVRLRELQNLIRRIRPPERSR